MKSLFVLFCFLIAATVNAQDIHGDATDIQKTSDSSDIIMDKVLQSKIPVLLDFWATWCMPCRMLSPTLEELKKKYQDKISVIKVNVDANRKMAGIFSVSSIPAVFIVKDRSVLRYIPGYREKEIYERSIQQVLADADSAAAASVRKTPPVKPVK